MGRGGPRRQHRVGRQGDLAERHPLPLRGAPPHPPAEGAPERRHRAVGRANGCGGDARQRQGRQGERAVHRAPALLPPPRRTLVRGAMERLPGRCRSDDRSRAQRDANVDRPAHDPRPRPGGTAREVPRLPALDGCGRGHDPSDQGRRRRPGGVLPQSSAVGQVGQPDPARRHRGCRPGHLREPRDQAPSRPRWRGPRLAERPRPLRDLVHRRPDRASQGRARAERRGAADRAAPSAYRGTDYRTECLACRAGSPADCRRHRQAGAGSDLLPPAEGADRSRLPGVAGSVRPRPERGRAGGVARSDQHQTGRVALHRAPDTRWRRP